MSLKLLRNIFIFGTIGFFAVLVVLTVNSMQQVNAKRTPELTDAVVSGKKVWQNRNCNDCHTILGIGGYWAPDMTKEATVRDAQFLTAWLSNPQAVKPTTNMPNQHLSATQVSNVIAFLTWVSQVDTNNWPPQPRFLNTGSGASQGQLLLQQKTCTSCHRINGQGSSGPGPDLSHIATQLAAQTSNVSDFLDKFLQNPKSVISSSTMPTIPLTATERQSIVQYLAGLK